MATVTIPPAEEARDVFKRLGYVIEERGSEFVAERKWRRVQVTPLRAENAKSPGEMLEYGSEGGPRLRCFVTWMDCAEPLRSSLQSAKPPYDWAIIGIEPDGEFQVVHPDPGSAPI